MELLERAFMRRDESAADELLVGLWRDVSTRHTDVVSLFHTRAALSSFRPENATSLPDDARVTAKLFFVAWVLAVPDCAQRPLLPPFLSDRLDDGGDPASHGKEKERVQCFVLSLRAYFGEKYLQGGEPGIERDLAAVCDALREC